MIILASASPRRSEILKTAGFEFEVIPSQAREIIPENADPATVVMSLAKQKAVSVAAERRADTVVGADTVVVLDGRILGKPADLQQAREMLESLSGKQHSVFTGVAIAKNGRTAAFCEETRVRFYPLTHGEIENYLACGESMDKAGAYGIQGRGCTLVEGIDGDYFNVVGFPVSRFVRELDKVCNRSVTEL